MSGWYLLVAIPVFALLVLVHEFGHFITAKWAGIRVEEFGIGFPPRLIGVKRGETIYSINALPLGGFVRMPGENGEMTDEQGLPDPGSFASKPASKRAIVLLAGVTMNLLLAIVLFSAAEAVGQTVPRPVVGSVLAGSPAAQAGITPGDQILAINGHTVGTYATDPNSPFITPDATVLITQATQNAPAKAKTVPVRTELRTPSGQTETVTVNALVHPDPTQGHFGVGWTFAHPYVVHTVPAWQAPVAGVRDIGVVITLTGNAFNQIVHGQLPWNQAVQGPVGIVRDTGLAAAIVPSGGWYTLLFLVGALSLNLAIVNILPVPALDGGRVLFVIIEVLRRGRRISPEREALVNLIGMGALLCLMAIVTINDVGTLFGGH